jgi:hypothetical protein
MRRLWFCAFLAVALLAVPEAAPAQGDGGDDGLAAVAEPTTAAPPWHRWEAPRGAFIEFGARLANRAANGLATCRTATLFPNNYNSCSWESLDLGTGESFLPPIGNGRITQIRIKAGNNTGQMRVVVLRAMRVASTGAYVCCTARSTTAAFTPRRNQITTLNVNLPVVQSRVPNAFGVYIDDHLALSMLNGNTVIPFNVDNGGTSLSGWYPRWQVGQERTGPYGTSGGMILMRMRWRRN